MGWRLVLGAWVGILTAWGFGCVLCFEGYFELKIDIVCLHNTKMLFYQYRVAFPH